MEPTWMEHFDLIQTGFGVIVGVVAWFMIRTLQQIDKNQERTAQQLADLSEKFYTLKGQHEELMCNHKGHDSTGDKLLWIFEKLTF